MKTIAIGVVCAALATAVGAQGRPDFSGVWTPAAIKAEPKPSSGGVVALPPSDLTIEQTAESMAMSRTAFDRVTTERHSFDGAENTNRSGAVTRVTRGRWDGPRFVIEGRASQVTSLGYDAWTLKQVYSIDRRGRLLIESEQVTSGGERRQQTMEYTKKQP